MPVFNADFTDVGDGFTLPQEGEHICKVKSVSIEQGPKAKYLKWVLVIGTGVNKGSTVYHITSLSADALFGLRNFLIACGQDVPKAAFKVNTDLCIGKVVGINLVHNEYTPKDAPAGSTEKKKSAKITEVFQVVKGDSGWVRVGGTAKEEVLDSPVKGDEALELEADEIDI